MAKQSGKFNSRIILTKESQKKIQRKHRNKLKIGQLVTRMEEVSNDIQETKEKIRQTEEDIRQAKVDGDKDYVKMLTAYLVELQKKENLLLSTPSGNFTIHFNFHFHID